MSTNKWKRLIRMILKKKLYQLILLGISGSILYHITGMPFGKWSCIMELRNLLKYSDELYASMPKEIFDVSFIFPLWILFGLIFIAFNLHSIYPSLVKYKILNERYYAKRIHNPWKYENNVSLFLFHHIAMCVVYIQLLINIVLTYECVIHKV